MKIVRIEFRRMRNEEHFYCMSDMDKLFMSAFVQRSLSQMDIIDADYTIFKELLRKEDVAIERVAKNDLTDPIVDADTVRDNMHIGLRTFVSAYAYHSDAEKVEAARKLTIVLDHYGDIRRKSYNEESAAIHNIVQDINENYADEAELIGADEWVAGLEDANTRFGELMNQRYDDNASLEEIDLPQTRTDIDIVFGRLRDMVEATNLMSGGVTFADLINRMNERLMYYKNTLATRKGRAEAEKKKKEDPTVPTEE